jgi:hypothetical protein
MDTNKKRIADEDRGTHMKRGTITEAISEKFICVDLRLSRHSEAAAD